MTHRRRAPLSKERETGMEASALREESCVCQVVLSLNVLKVGKDSSSWRDMAAWQTVTSPEHFS